MNKFFAHIIIMIAAAAVTGTLSAQTPITIYNNFSGPVNYTVIGGSLRTQGNTINATSLRSSDTSKLYLPSGSTIVGAYLYWAGSGATADNLVNLSGQNFTASRTFTEQFLNGSWLYFFGGFADVTAFAQSNGYPFTYEFGGLTVDSTTAVYVNSQAVISAWSMIVVYRKDSEVKKSVNIFDGFKIFRGSQIPLVINNFYVPYSLVQGKMTHITFEGDKENSSTLNGFNEEVRFNGVSLTDIHNPANNQFGSLSNNFPEDSTFGLDIDTYDVTSLLTPADTQATSTYSSGGDLVILSAEIISVADTANSDIQTTKTHAGGSIVAGNNVVFTISVQNNGPDTTGIITLVDSIRSGLTFVSSTHAGWTIDSTQKPKYIWTRNAVHPPNTTLPPVTVTAYLTAENYPTQLNTAYASSPQFDRKPWNNASTDSVPILTPIFLTSVKSYNDLNGGSVRPGDTLVYTINVSNTGNYPATNISVIDSMPTGMSVVPGSFSPSATYTGTSATGQVVTFNNFAGPLNVGNNTSFIFRVVIDSTILGGSTVTNVARVRAQTIDQRVTSSFVPVNAPNLKIRKYLYPPGSGTKNGDTVQYYIVVKNHSTFANSSSMTIVDTIPNPNGTNTRNPYYLASGTVPSATIASFGTAGNQDTSLTWNRGVLAPGQSDTMKFKMRISSTFNNNPAIVTNKATVFSNQGSRDSSSFSYLRSNTFTGSITGTQFILPGDTIYYELYDADLNTNNATIQTVTLTSGDTNRVTGERETIVLTETGANTGVFKGKIATMYGATAGTNLDGKFNVKPGDSLRISYTDAVDSAGNTNSWRRFVTKVLNGHAVILNGTTTILPTQSISYTLNDSDLNRNSGAIETYTIRDSNQTTGEIENILFTETGINTGIFTATVPTVFGTVSNGNNNGTFAVQKGDTITLKYYDTVIVNGTNGGLKTWKTYVRGGATATITATSPVRPADSILITITDADLNKDSTSIQTYTVKDSSISTGEVETFIVTETGVNTGIFTKKLATQFGLTAGTNNDGKFNVKAGDSLRVWYLDTLQANGGPGTIKIAGTVVIGGTAGTITATNPIYPGDSVLITITDADLNKNASAVESYTFKDSSIATGEVETFVATETGINTGIFTKKLATQFGLTAGTNNDGKFNVKAGDTLRVSYFDSLIVNGGTATVSAITSVRGGINATLTAASPIYPSDSILITITDNDLNKDTTTIQSYTVKDSSIATGEVETFTVTETGVNTGIFTKKLATQFGLTAGTNNDGKFNVKAGDTLRVTYFDTLQVNGGSALLTANTRVNGGVTATLTATTPIIPGDSVLITITDADLNKNASVAETYTVKDSSIATGEVETFTVTETGVNTGIFTKKLATQFGLTAGTNNDGKFNVKAGDTLRVTYFDTLQVNGGSALLTANTRVNGGVTATLTANPAIIAANDTSTFTLTDNDLNSNPSTIQSYNITVTSSTGESELFVFTETGVNTGVFTKFVPTVYGTTPGVNNNGLFTVQPGDTIKVSYLDSLRSQGDTATISTFFRIGSVNFSTSTKSYQDLNGGFVMPPDTLQYKVTVKNTGTVTATNVVMKDTLPSDVTVVSGTITGGGTVSNQVISWPVFTLIVGDSATYQYQIRIDSTIESQVASINKATIDGNGIRQQVTASFIPVNRPLMTMTKSANRATAKPGDTILYTINYSNIGTSAATFVTMTDTQPDNTTYVPNTVTLNAVAKTDAADADEVTLTGSTIQLNIGVVQPGVSGTVTLKMRVN